MLKLLVLIATFFSTIAGYAAASLSRKAIVAVAVIVAFLAVTVAFLAAFNVIISGVTSLIAIPAWISGSIGLFIPSNYAGVLSAILAAKTCKAAYNLAIEKVKLIGQST